MKVRIDKLLVDRGLAQSRERAQALILAGKVLVNEQKIVKAGALVPEEADVRLLGEDLRYVSRGGLKLEAALHHWLIDARHRCCLDVGASTGGFTDCLLQHGAAHVIAVDTGYGQLDFRLRQDPRVRLLEKTNARYLQREDIGEAVELVVVDVSFISATLVLPPVLAAAFPELVPARAGAVVQSRSMALAAEGKRPAPETVRGPVPRSECDACARSSMPTAPGTLGEPQDKSYASPMREVIVLVKPQFEAGREYVEKGGVVRNPAAHRAAIDKVRRCLVELGAGFTDVIESPILGMSGNREFLLRAQFVLAAHKSEEPPS